MYRDRHRGCVPACSLSIDLWASPPEQQRGQHVGVHALDAHELAALKYWTVITVNGAPPGLLLDHVRAGFHGVGIGVRKGRILPPSKDGDAIDPEHFPDVSKRVALAQQVQSQRLAARGRQPAGPLQVSRTRSRHTRIRTRRATAHNLPPENATGCRNRPTPGLKLRT
jgi:hypothetical protein